MLSFSLILSLTRVMQAQQRTHSHTQLHILSLSLRRMRSRSRDERENIKQGCTRQRDNDSHSLSPSKTRASGSLVQLSLIDKHSSRPLKEGESLSSSQPIVIVMPSSSFYHSLPTTHQDARHNPRQADTPTHPHRQADRRCNSSGQTQTHRNTHAAAAALTPL